MFGNVIDFSDKISVTRFSISIFFFPFCESLLHCLTLKWFQVRIMICLEQLIS